MLASGPIAVGGENLIDYVNNEGVETAFPGGSPFNVAIALGRLGADVCYVSPISTDRWGDMLAETLVRAGVTLTAGRRPEPTTMARVTVRKGHPSYSFERLGTAERAVTAQSLAAAMPDACRAIHTGSLTLTDGPDAAAWERFLAGCADRGLLVSVDPNVRLSVVSDRPAYIARIMRIFGRADLVKLSDEDLAALFPGQSEDAAIAALRAASPARLVILTRGAEGASAWLGEVRIEVPAVAVATLGDTVGAGDTFTAAVLAGLAEHGARSPDGLAAISPEATRTLLHRASTAAALNCAREGCDPPTRAELDAALNREA